MISVNITEKSLKTSADYHPEDLLLKNKTANRSSRFLEINHLFSDRSKKESFSFPC